MDRNRVLLKVFEYWHSKLAGRRLPSRSDILPGELLELLPFLFLADVRTLTPMGCEINLRLAGTHIERALGVNLTGCPVGGIAKHWRDFAIGRDLFDAVNQHCAIAVTHQFLGTEIQDKHQPLGQAFLRYHRLVLPLSSDGRKVDRILGALVAEIHENSQDLWLTPFKFEELAKKRLPFPFRASAARLMAQREHPVPA